MSPNDAATGAVTWNGTDPAERRGLDACGPDLDGRLDPPQHGVGGVRIDAVFIDPRDHRREVYLDAHPLELGRGTALKRLWECSQ